MLASRQRLALFALVAAAFVATVASASSETESSSSRCTRGRIVFARTDSQGFHWQLFTMRANGSDVRALRTDTLDNLWPTYSPNGKKIAFVRRDQTHESEHIYVMNSDGTNAHALTHGKEADESPAWSPDGRRIAFVSKGRIRRPYFRLYTIGADDRGLRLARSPGGNVFSPSWSPDGRRIVLSANSYNYSGFRLVIVDPKRDTVLRALRSTGNTPAWSPQANKIAFVNVRECNPPSNYCELHEIQLTDPRGRTVRALVTNADYPRWSPDGKALLYQAAGKIVVRDLRTGAEAKLADGGQADWQPRCRSGD